MPDQDIVQRLATEKGILEVELRGAVQAIVFQHGKTLEEKMHKLIVKDDYGTENYEKFLKERDYFIKTVMVRDVPPSIWDFFFSESETREQIFHQNLGLYFERRGETSEPQIKGSRPINEIVQQAEMLMNESALLAQNKYTEGIDEDPLFEQAVQVVLSNRKASISLVQRHLKIGYIRSARLVEAMEARGIVSQMNGSGQREILDFSRAGNVNAMPIGCFNSSSRADPLLVRQLVEDHWKAFLLAGRQNPAIGARMIEAFDQRIQAQVDSLPADTGAAFKAIVESERGRLFAEYEASPELLMQRLNIGQTVRPAQEPFRQRTGHGFGELVVRTAVRATIWEIVRSIFRR